MSTPFRTNIFLHPYQSLSPTAPLLGAKSVYTPALSLFLPILLLIFISKAYMPGCFPVPLSANHLVHPPHGHVCVQYYPPWLRLKPSYTPCLIHLPPPLPPPVCLTPCELYGRPVRPHTLAPCLDTYPCWEQCCPIQSLFSHYKGANPGDWLMGTIMVSTFKKSKMRKLNG